MIDWLLRDPKVPRSAPSATIRETIEVAGREVPLVIRRLTNARRMTLRLSPTADEVRVSLPRWGRIGEARAFVAAKSDWIARQLAAAPRRFAEGPDATIAFRGETLPVRWSERYPRRPCLDDGALILGGPRESVPGRVQRWLEAQAQGLLEEDVRHYAARAALDAPVLRLARAQRRWGSCTADGTVRINWRLVMAPDDVRQSVVAHEIAHLVHFDHSPAFHAALARIFDGNLHAANRWLARHGRTLYHPFG